MLSRAQKQEQAEEIKDKFSRATCVYLADYRGIDVESVNRLRRRIRAEGAGDFEYRVVKNTVIQRAAAETDMAGISGHFEGPTAVAISYGDPVGLAKILADFADEHDVFEIKAGLLEGTPIEADEIRKLASLPSPRRSPEWCRSRAHSLPGCWRLGAGRKIDPADAVRQNRPSDRANEEGRERCLI